MVRFVLLCVLLFSLNTSADTLKVAVAANFKPLLNQLKPDFETRHNSKVVLSSGSTGVLYAQIRNGAPFDVFLAADEKRPRLLAEQDRALSNSRKTYAIGQLVLWHPKQKPSVQLLKDWQGKIAIANAKTAPYGFAAKTVLEHLGLWQQKRKFLVRGSNIAQTQQFVQSGNVQLGFIALSQAKVLGDEQNYWTLPRDWYTPILQQAVVLKSTQQIDKATAFLTWLMSKPIQQQIVKAGYASDVI